VAGRLRRVERLEADWLGPKKPTASAPVRASRVRLRKRTASTAAVGRAMANFENAGIEDCVLTRRSGAPTAAPGMVAGHGAPGSSPLSTSAGGWRWCVACSNA
jgi:hypothetical protein